MKSHVHAALAVAAAAVGASAAATTGDDFNWDAITPSHDIEYHACYDTFQCARLLLPLDWLNTTSSSSSSNATIALALIQSPASVPLDDPTYAGPVLSNPGGPGGSGVDHLRRAAAQHRDMVDTPGRKHFEYVSFDPRGIGRTTPQVNCYPEGKLARTAATLKARGSGGLDGGPAAVPWNLGLAELAGGRCEEANGELLKYVGTTSVARDMLAVVEKIDEYNKKHRKTTAVVMEEEDARLELRSVGGGKDKELPRLQYLGFSYGTVLGNYFASLFPERIGRILLDGVCDIDDYATGDGWLTNTVDTDEMVDLFFQGCFDAGASVCPLHRATDKSGADIARRFWAWVASLDQTPTFVTKDGGDDTYILQSNDLRGFLLLVMYKPLDLFQQAAATADAAMHGNTTALYDLLAEAAGGPLEDACPIGNQTSSAAGTPDAQSAVLCGDGDDITGRNATFWRAYVAQQLKQSAVAGASWGNVRLACSNWKTRAAWQFHGPFTAPPSSADVPGKPAAPLLFLSNRYDPVTPLRAARKVAAKYPGAGLLVQESMGHCVFGGGTAATECTRSVVRRYFDQGVVPHGETTCEAACEPWGDKCEAAGAMSIDGGFRHDWRFPLHI